MNKFQATLAVVALGSSVLVGCANTSALESKLDAIAADVDKAGVRTIRFKRTVVTQAQHERANIPHRLVHRVRNILERIRFA